MQVTIAIAVLTHRRTYATKPERGLQFETRIRAIIWMMVVKVMEMIAKPAVSVMSVARAIATTLGKRKMRRT